MAILFEIHDRSNWHTLWLLIINEEFASSKLQILFIDLWKSKLFNDSRQQGYGNKLRTYRKFKLIFTQETYLNIIPSFETRKEMCRLRISNHKLQIEKGRHNNIALENRLCTNCHVIEDEEHFLTVCSKFKEDRNMLYDIVKKSCPNFTALPNENKLIYLLSCENEEIIKEVGNFICKNVKNLHPN